MNKFRLLICCLAIAFLAVGCLANPGLFSDNKEFNQIHNIDTMNYDGRYYWFCSIWGRLVRFDPSTRKLEEYNFNNGDGIEGIFCLSIVDQQLWAGLTSRGIAVYHPEVNQFAFYDMTNGLPGYTVEEDRYNKVTAITYDQYANLVWVGSIGAGVSYFDLKSQKWFTIKESLAKKLDVTAINVSENYVSVVANQGIYLLDKKDWQWQSVGTYPDNTGFRSAVLVDKTLYFTVRQHDHCLLAKYDFASGKISGVLSWETTYSCLTKVHQFLAFCSSKGLTFINPKNLKTKTFTEGDGLINKSVDTIYLDDTYLWVISQYGINQAKIKDVLKELEEIN